MSSTALDNTICFPNFANKKFRSAEWADRISQTAGGLAALAEHFVLTQRNVSVTDCTKLDAISNASFDAQPWGSREAPVQDSQGRSYLHLKAVFWDGDPASRVPNNVSRANWAAWIRLSNEGLDTVSLHYFVFSSPANGYFSNWRAALPSLSLNGTPIDPINPTPEGIKSRDVTIASDTTNLIAWVKTHQ